MYYTGQIVPSPCHLYKTSRRYKVTSANARKSKHRLVILLYGPKFTQRPSSIVNKHSFKADNKKKLSIEVLWTSVEERLDSATDEQAHL